MLKLNLTEEMTFWRKVQVEEPGEDGPILREIKVLFPILPAEEYAGLIQHLSAEGMIAEIQAETGQDIDALGQQELQRRISDKYVQRVERICLDWEGVADEHGTAIPFSPENRRHVLRFPFVTRSILDEYRRAMNGEVARLGNSETSAAPGQAQDD